MGILRHNPAGAAWAAVAVVCLALTSCGLVGTTSEAPAPSASAGETRSSSDEAKSTTKPSSRPRGSSLKTQLVRKLKSEPDMSGMPAKFISCMADAMARYADKNDLKRYLSGSITNLDAVKMTDKAAAEKAGWACTKLV